MDILTEKEGDTTTVTIMDKVEYIVDETLPIPIEREQILHEMTGKVQNIVRFNPNLMFLVKNIK